MKHCVVYWFTTEIDAIDLTILQKEKHMKNIIRLFRHGELLLVVLCLFVTTNPLYAQWIQTNGPQCGAIYSLAVSGQNLFAGAVPGGVYRSIDNGNNWSDYNRDLVKHYVRSLAISGNYLFAGTQGNGVFYSIDNGNHWTEFNNGIGNHSMVFSLVVGGEYLFAGTQGGVVFRCNLNNISASTNWDVFNPSGLGNYDISSLAVNGTNIFAGTVGGGVFYSNINGTSWSAINTSLTNTYIRALTISGTKLFAGSDGGGVFQCDLNSLNTNASWFYIGLNFMTVWSLTVSDTYLFAGINGGGVMRFDGTSWTQSDSIDPRFMNSNIYSLAIADGNIYAGTDGGGVFRSLNNGISWEEVNNGMTASIVPTLTESGSNLFAGTQGGGVFHSSNNGTSWEEINTGLPNSIVYDFASIPNGSGGTNLFAGTYGGVFLSANNGITWEAANNGLTNHFVYTLAVSGTNIFTGHQASGGVFLSTNNGAEWIAVNNGLTNKNVQALAVSGTVLFAGTNGGVFRSMNNGTSWEVVNSGLTNTNIHSLILCGTNLFAGTQGGGIFLSTNNGATWSAVNNGLTSPMIYSFAVSGTNIFAGTYNGVFLSTNNGANWTAVNTGLRTTLIVSLSVNGSNIFAGTIGAGVWKRPLSEMITTIIYSQNPCPGLPTVSYAGKTYTTIQIGTQCWLKENLDVGTMIQGSQEQSNNGTIEKYCYDNNPSNCAIYGGMYQWNEAMQFSTTPGTKGICPTGWHIPTAAEWRILSLAVGGDGNALLAVGQGNGTNTSGFSALFVGNRGLSTYFADLGNAAYFWSSTEVVWDVSRAENRSLINSSSNFGGGYNFKGHGVSIRCLKDEQVGTAPNPPTLLSPMNNEIGISTSRTLKWNAVSGATSYTLQVSTNSSFSSFVYYQSGLTGTSKQVSGLTNQTQYYWRVSATNSYGTSGWSSEWSFTTLNAISVRYECNMEIEILGNRFNPSMDYVELRGNEFGWIPGVRMQQDQTNQYIYYYVKVHELNVGDNIPEYKFWYSTNSNWENGSNRTYQVTQQDIINGYIFISRHFDDLNLNNVTNVPTTILFQINTIGGHDVFGNPIPSQINTLHLTGSTQPLSWRGWSDNTSDEMIPMFDDGTHGDKVAGDKIYSNTLTFNSYTPFQVQFAYVINFVQSGFIPYENPAGDNHIINLEKNLLSGKVINVYGFMSSVTGVTPIIADIVALNGGLNEPGGLTMTFENVTVAGNTSVEISSTGPTLPSGFMLGNPPTYYDITTTSVFSGSISLCFNYTGLTFEGDESNLKLYHFVNGDWADETLSIDIVNNIICASVTSLSPFVILAPAPGKISGTTLVGSSALPNVIVKILDKNGNPLIGVDEQRTDANGQYSFAKIFTGDYQVMIVEPLGYFSDGNPKQIKVNPGGNYQVNFILTPVTITNNNRGMGYWKQQFDKYITKKGTAQETEAQLNDYINKVHKYYTPHFNTFSGLTTFANWQAVLSPANNSSMLNKARQLLAALVMNFVSFKIGQGVVVTADGRTAGDLLTYVSTLVIGSDATKYELAKNLAEQVCNQQTIAVGLVPVGNVLYKNGSGQQVNWNFNIPKDYSLLQNYPNPFNPSTTISYQIPKAGHVEIKIFDLLGRELSMLVNSDMSAGKHEVKFDGSNLSSGVYFYRMTAENFVSTRKLLLMK